MKKTLIISIFLIMSLAFLPAQTLSGCWSGGNFGGGVYLSDDCSTNVNIELNILDFTFKHNDTGLLLSFTPLYLDSFSEDDHSIQQENNLVSFINVKLGLDLLKNKRDFDLLPYVSLNWAPLSGLSSYRAEAGLEFDWYADNIIFGTDYPLRVKICRIKTACGFRRNEPYFTAGASVDFLALLHGAFLSWLYDETDDDR